MLGRWLLGHKLLLGLVHGALKVLNPLFSAAVACCDFGLRRPPSSGCAP